MNCGETAAGTQCFTVRVNVFGLVPVLDTNVTLTRILDVATGVGSFVVTRVAVLLTVTRFASLPLT